ncbi:alpha/beta hydrolase family protein [Xanthomonas sacchari]|uniref:alpha/beta hydrolase family protein n=1 Tax=Xanthomonas sacchari TaxID=56458 RepID=UPI0022517A02|nr:alpha/beta fold hydrolase [Xanthomonas sacchari]MCW0456237.1 hypothetical protein [Xanthomonas sacchari]
MSAAPIAATAIAEHALPVAAADGHRWSLLARLPDAPRQALLWLPALGVAARHYLPFAEALAAHGVAVFLHEWRGNGSSTLRPSRQCDWGYRALLHLDLPASQAAIAGCGIAAPLLVGGHSLGGQLACCYASLQPQAFAALWLVASGTPYWRRFPAPRGYLLPLAYRLLPWLAQRQGVLHGRRLGFGGTEARGLIADWARVGRSGRYAAAGLAIDLEAQLAHLTLPARGVVLQDDWLAPESSLRGLLDKLATPAPQIRCLDATQLGVAADHFAWMKRPAAVAAALLAGDR